MSIALFDWCIVIGFLSLTMMIGLLVSNKSAESSNQFFLSGRNMPWWLLGISMVATTFSTDTPNLVTEIVRNNGVSGNWVWWVFLITGLMTVFIYAKLWRKSNVKTDIEFYELRYSGKPARFLRLFRTFYLGVIFNIMAMAGISLAAIKIGQVMLGLSAFETIGIAGLVTVLFSVLGGFRGVVYTDFVLFFFAMAGSIGAAFYLVNLPEIGGVSSLLEHPNISGKISMLPDFSNNEQVIMLFIIPLAVQWWSAWYPGSEPGGGGYVAQRMLAAKNENHAMGATFFFNLMHYAVRPWPWILIALASIIVFPNIESLQEAFPNTIVGNDLAYPAMISFLPSGLLGLLVASLIAAFMSTISTHLNWGSSYLVHDLYRRFYVKYKSEKHYVFMGRVFTVLLMIISAFFALYLNNSLQAFGIILQIGAGTGLIFILRWFWYRINVYSELTAMIVSFIVALAFEFIIPNNFSVEEKLIIGVTITTISWITVTMITPPSRMSVLQDFYKKIQPGGPGWKKVIDESKSNGIDITGKKEKWDVPNGILCMVFGSISVYSILFGIGYILYSEITLGITFIVISVISVMVLMRFWKRLSTEKN